MASAKIKIVNDDGVVILEDNRDVICLLKKNGSAPSGTLFTASGGGNSYHFGHPPSSASSSKGVKVQIYDDGGSLLFDALRYGKLAKPVGVLSVNHFNYPTNSGSQSKTFASGKTYAVWVSQRPSAFIIRNYAIKVGSQYQYQYLMDDVTASTSISGSKVTLEVNVQRDSNPKGSPSSVPYTSSGVTAARAVVFDVTNF